VPVKVKIHFYNNKGAMRKNKIIHVYAEMKRNTRHVLENNMDTPLFLKKYKYYEIKLVLNI
jgi:hypothetical protein